MNTASDKTAIVSGATGFVGGAVTRELLNCGYKVYALCRPGSAKRLPQDSKCIPVEFDLADPAALLRRLQPGCAQYFFHFAWSGSAGPERGDVRLQLDNAAQSAALVQIAAKLGCRRLIAAGSVTEQEAYAAVMENGTQPGIGYIYGTAKFSAHALMKCEAARSGISFVSGRITNIYGPLERSPRLVNTTIRKCLKGVSPVFTSGTQLYDFIFVSDAARAFRLIAEKGRDFYEYVVGSGKSAPLRSFLERLQAAVAPGLEFRFGSVPFTGTDLKPEVFSTELTYADTGFTPEIPFEEGCRRTRDWIVYEEQKDQLQG